MFKFGVLTLTSLWANSADEKLMIIPTLVKKSNGDIMNASVHLSVCLSNHWSEFNQTCYMTSLQGKGVQEQYYFSLLST